MASLAEEIRRRLREKDAPAAATGGGEIGRILQTKATGKATAGAGAGPAVSNIAEQAAQSQAQAQQQTSRIAGGVAAQQVGQAEEELRQRGELAREEMQSRERMATQQVAGAEQMATEERVAKREEAGARLSSAEQQKTAQLNSAYQNELARIAAERRINTEDMLQQFSQGNAELASRKDAAQLEQILHVQALSNQKYVDELQRVGRLQRLEDEVRFKEEAAQLAFGDDLQRLLQDMGFKAGMLEDERAFQEMLANIDIDTALALGRTEIKQENTKAIAEGVTGAVSEGIDYYKQTNKKSNAKAEESEE